MNNFIKSGCDVSELSDAELLALLIHPQSIKKAIELLEDLQAGVFEPKEVHEQLIIFTRLKPSKCMNSNYVHENEPKRIYTVKPV